MAAYQLLKSFAAASASAAERAKDIRGEVELPDFCRERKIAKADDFGIVLTSPVVQRWDTARSSLQEVDVVQLTLS